MTNAARDTSLIERAAEIYDFGKHLRGTTASVRRTGDDPDSSLLEEEGVSGRIAPGNPRSCRGHDRPATHTQHGGGVSTYRGGDTPPSSLRDATSPFRGGLESGNPAVPEWCAAPVGVAAIDRAMLAQKGMLVPGAPIGALAEEFRLVKRQLLLTAKTVSAGVMSDRARTILVGSGKPGDGKTFCAINLALSMAAERDTNVLLVDGDFAKPDVMKTLGQDDSTGFLDILGDNGLDPESCVVATDVPHLSLLPAGKRTNHDTELLASARTGAVIDRLLAADPRRIIIFDTPPALAASPASVLALQVGQVMLVVRADRTTESDVAKAVALLDGCEHISLVLNSVSYAAGDGRFGSYYGQER